MTKDEMIKRVKDEMLKNCFVSEPGIDIDMSAKEIVDSIELDEEALHYQWGYVYTLKEHEKKELDAQLGIDYCNLLLKSKDIIKIKGE